MQNSNPTTSRKKIPATLAIVAAGVTCFLGVSQTKAQSLGDLSFPQQLAPRVGKIEAERIYRPTRPVGDKLTSISSESNDLRFGSMPESGFSRPATAAREVIQPTSQSADVKRRLDSVKRRFADAKQRLAVANPIPPTNKAAPVAQFKSPPLRTSNDSSTSTISQAAFNDSTESRNLSPPTVLIRPSVTSPEHLNQCVVEINEVKSTNDVTLKVAIPDSVTMVEVVPNRSSGTTRNFRIKMEQGVQPQRETEQPEPVDYLAQRQQQRAPQPRVASSPTSAPAEKTNKSFGAGYSKNPFFGNSAPPVAETRQTVVRAEQVKSLPSQAYPSHTVGVRDFLQRTSHLSPSQTPRPEELEELSHKPEPQAAEFAHGFLPTKPIVAAQIIGPASVDLGQTADYMVAIVNPMNHVNQGLEVDLDVPKGLEIVLLDRPAEFNKRKRTLRWKLNEILPGEEVRLKYRVKSTYKGKHRQRVSVRVAEELLETHEIVTRSDLNLNADATELPFE